MRVCVSPALELLANFFQIGGNRLSINLSSLAFFEGRLTLPASIMSFHARLPEEHKPSGSSCRVRYPSFNSSIKASSFDQAVREKLKNCTNVCS